LLHLYKIVNMNFYGKSVRISNDVHQQMIEHLTEAVKIGKWVENAIKEKIERDTNKGNPIFERFYDRLETKNG